jgi:hypothetical protein
VSAPTSGGFHDTRPLLASAPKAALTAVRALRGGLPSLRCRAKTSPAMDTLDIAQLCAATLVGIVLGLNRDLHGKPTGVRTLGIL